MKGSGSKSPKEYPFHVARNRSPKSLQQPFYTGPLMLRLTTVLSISVMNHRITMAQYLKLSLEERIRLQGVHTLEKILLLYTSSGL